MRPRYLAALAVLPLIACLWFFPLFKGEQLGQSYVLYSYPPWAAARPAEPLPQRAVFPDAALAFNPWATVARDQVRDGHLPLWNPYEYGGTVLAGNMQSALFFPLSWLLFLLPLGYAWGAFAVGKVLIAGLGAYALSRELRIGRGGALLAGAVYMLSAPSMLLLQFPLGTVAALFPWLLLATTRLHERRTAGAVAGVGLATGLSLLAGHPETTLIAASAAAVYLLVLTILGRRRPMLAAPALWGGGLLLGAAVAAVVLIPFLEALGPSVTRTERPFFPSVGLPVSDLLHYAVPWVFGNAEPHLYGFPFGYFGLPALVLATLALVRFIRTPAAAALAAMAAVALMAAYHVAPVIWFLDNVPPWSHAYLRERVYFVVALAGAVGAGAALSALQRSPLSLRRAGAVLALAALVVAAGFGLAELGGSLSAPGSLKRESLALAAGFLAATGALLVAAGRLRPLASTGLALVIAVLSLADLHNLNVTLPPDQAYPGKPPAIAALQSQPQPFRMSVIRRPQGPFPLLPNTAALYGLESVEGYDFPLSERWSDLQTSVLHFVSPNAESRAARHPPRGAALTALRMMNVRYYLAAPRSKPPVREFQYLYRGRDGDVYRDPRALPRAYLVPSTRRLSEDGTIAALAHGRLDPRQQALVPTDAPRTSNGSSFHGLRTRRLSPDHVRVYVPPGSSGWLVLANAYAPSWKAEVDGRETKLYPTNLAAMGVPVSPSAHTVDFRLDRSGFWLGAVISLAALACAALLAIISWRRGSRSSR